MKDSMYVSAEDYEKAQIGKSYIVNYGIKNKQTFTSLTLDMHFAEALLFHARANRPSKTNLIIQLWHSKTSDQAETTPTYYEETSVEESREDYDNNNSNK